MELVRAGNQLLYSGSSLSGSTECCCQQDLRVTNCNQCCGQSVLPEELAVSVNFQTSGMVVYSNIPFGFSFRGVSLLSQAVAFSGVLVLKKQPPLAFAPCWYYFASCGQFGDFAQIECALVLSVVNQRCVVSASFGAALYGCILEQGLANSIENGGCCDAGQDTFYGGSGKFSVPVSLPYVDNTPVVNAPAFSSPCSFYYSRSGTASFASPQVNLEGTSGPLRFSGQCECSSFSGTPLPGYPSFSTPNPVTYSLELSAF